MVPKKVSASVDSGGEDELIIDDELDKELDAEFEDEVSEEFAAMTPLMGMTVLMNLMMVFKDQFRLQ